MDKVVSTMIRPGRDHQPEAGRWRLNTQTQKAQTALQRDLEKVHSELDDEWSGDVRAASAYPSWLALRTSPRHSKRYDDEGHRRPSVGEAHNEIVDPAAKMRREKAEARANECADRGTDNRDHQL
ncbi:hypothetical protein PanWU01x14_160870 [Parasponia andersonii]|uniref:Uncharacterized protein n=1 Tax=Parasponia andersonii TaxID=3476 RepID=A0A2P5CDM9_PARAD|nr:hypothetical protein PanWU01x14_160870 [Parasponia andersonii]